MLERIGQLGGKLRAGRSRNDQIATDLRLYVRDHARVITARLTELEFALMDQAERHQDTPAPGMTHMQQAQPVLFAHHLLAYVEMFASDVSRLRDPDARAAVSPLGSGALAASHCPSIGRQWPRSSASPARLPTPWTPWATATSRSSSASPLALLGVHVSRLAEELVLWSTPEFSWVELDDAYSTGSSIMPQKKNPDVELARGKAGSLIGDLHRPADDPARACRSPTTAICRRTRSRSSTRSTPFCWCCRPWPGWSAR